MASFRTGFKIFGEISLKQGLGRIRSFSEDRKPGQWLPEDQWAVRQPGSTCPDPCEKPKKPPKPSKSWLSICRDPAKEPECDYRHNNCPPPPRDDAPWYSLENFIPKKKAQEKTPPISSCREELKRREMYGEEEEVCENIQDKTFQVHIKSEPSDCCMPKSEPCPAPVVTLSCPLPKELDIMLWCEKTCTDTQKQRIPIPCQSDRLPYEEFRPQKIWKPPPFSLPCKSDQPSFTTTGRCPDSVDYAEFKYVDVPRHLYTRYKSVELSEKNLMLCMTDVQCPENPFKNLAVTPLPPPPLSSHPITPCVPPPTPKKITCPEKPLVEAASCKPVRLKKAPKYTFRPKPTKLIEKRVKQNPCPQCCLFDTSSTEEDKNDCDLPRNDESEPPKVITGTLTDEPQVFERELSLPTKPPRWLYAICKPGAKETPLVPCNEESPSEPDCSEETDGLRFYDGKDGSITPRPPPDPCAVEESKVKEATPPVAAEPAPTEEPEPCVPFKNRFVLMPQEYNIKFMRQENLQEIQNMDDSTFEKFIEVKSTLSKVSSKSYPPMKENILYDLQRLCPNPPLDPSKINAPCLKPPEPECPVPPRFYRRYSTFRPSTLGKSRSFQLCKIQRRTECEDTSGKCKARNLIPKPRPCPEPTPKPDCAEITLPCCPRARIPPDCDIKKPMPICKKKLPPKPSFSECSKDPLPCPRITECDCWEKKKNRKRPKSAHLSRHTLNRSRSSYANKVKCYTLKSAQEVSGSVKNRVVLGLKDSKDDSSCDYEPRPIITKPKTGKAKVHKKNGHLLPKPKKNSQPQTRAYTAVHEVSEAFCDEEKKSESEPDREPDQEVIQNQNFQSEKLTEEKVDEENLVTFYDPPEHIESSKAFMGSLGSWINELFSAPSKSLAVTREIEKDEIETEPTAEDPEYLKSISAIKEQFKRKLKSETSIQVAVPDKPFVLNFEKILDNPKKSYKTSMSLPDKNPPEWLDELDDVNPPVFEKSENLIRRSNPGLNTGGLVIRTSKAEENPTISKTADGIELNRSLLVKEKKKGKRRNRPDLSELEEYIFPTPSELSNRILLNINKDDKFGKFYNNSHMAVQEPQAYGQRKSKAHQTNARCYTTNANPTDSPRGAKPKVPTTGLSQFCTTTAATLRDIDEIFKRNSPDLRRNQFRKTSRKDISEMSRDSMTFMKMKSPKASVQVEVTKPEAKTSSDDLVKYLMKKIKTTRPQHYKNKGTSSLSQVVAGPKTRIMQSATNTLVNVMAKKESDGPLPAKTIPRVYQEGKLFPGKELIVKHSDANIRVDVSRAINGNKLSRLSYLFDDNRAEDDSFLIEKGSHKNTKRPYDDMIKKHSDMIRKQSNKFIKRQEVKNMFSKIDMHVFPKVKPRESKKKPLQLEDLSFAEARDAQNARFQKQHELFKTNLKMLQNTGEEPAEMENDDQANTSTSTSTSTPISTSTALSTQLAVVDENIHHDPEPFIKACDNQQNADCADPEEPDNNVDEVLDLEENSINQKYLKKMAENISYSKPKSKSVQIVKEVESKVMLSPLEKLYISEQQNEKESSKTYEPALCPTELAPVKPVDTLLLNRRYSTNILNESNQKSKLLPWNYHPVKSTLYLNDSRKEGDKKGIKEKRKLKSSKAVVDNALTLEHSCGLDKTKKKSNCEKDD